MLILFVLLQFGDSFYGSRLSRGKTSACIEYENLTLYFTYCSNWVEMEPSIWHNFIAVENCWTWSRCSILLNIGGSDIQIYDI